MKKVLFSIKPEFVEKIFSGEKRFEYRKSRCKREVDRIVIYCTSPCGKVVGEIEINRVLVGSPRKIWENTKKYSGISESFFNKYFMHKNIAVAYELGRVTRYKEPKTLSEYSLKVPPQSYVYID